MTPKVLIDLIVGQTTILIAQLSTAAGIRAPLGDISGQLFLELSRAIEKEGVPRKVIADMFGLALRGYQKKVQRLEESATDSGTTLWEAILSHVESAGPQSRNEIEERFSRDDQLSVAAVLKDLVSSGLLSRTGPRDASVYAARDISAEYLDEKSRMDELSTLIWTLAYNEPGMTISQIASRLGIPEQQASQAVQQLKSDGVLSRDVDEKGVQVGTLTIPVGSEVGWGAAVFDHYRAVATSISKKLRSLSQEEQEPHLVGGTTITFDINDNHPHRKEVLQLLEHTREETDRLWAKVRSHNEQHPMNEDERTRVTFYFGQSLTAPETEEK